MSSTIKSASKGSWRCDARYEVRILLDPWLCPQNFFRHCRRKHRLLMVFVNYIATSQPAIYLSVRLSVRVRPRPSASVSLSVCLGPQRYGVEVCMATTTTTILTMTHWTEDRFASKVAASELEYLERCEKKNRKNVGVQHELLIDCQQAHPLSWIFNVWASDTAKIVVWLPSLSPTIGEMTAGSLSLPVCLQSPRCRCQKENL